MSFHNKSKTEYEFISIIKNNSEIWLCNEYIQLSLPSPCKFSYLTITIISKGISNLQKITTSLQYSNSTWLITVIIAKVNLFWDLKMAYKIFKFFFESSLDNKPKELKIIRKSGVNICSHRNQKQLIGFSSKGFMTIFSMRTKSSLLFTPTEDYWWDPVAVSLFWSPTCASRNIMRIKNTSYLLHSLIDNTCLIYFWILNFVK